MRTTYGTRAKALGACAATLALAACSGSSGSANTAAATTPPIVALGGSPGSLASSGPSGTTPGAADGGLDHCHVNGLRVSTTYDTAQIKDNVLSVYIVLTNTSKSITCTEYGFAGVDFLDPSGKSLGMTVKRTNSGNITPINPVNLAPGQSAAERITFLAAANDQGNACVNAGTLAVIPPNETVQVHTQLTNGKTGPVPYFGVCTKTITAYPFTPASAIPK